MAALVALTFAGTQPSIAGMISSVTNVLGSQSGDVEQFAFSSGTYGIVYAGGEVEQVNDSVLLIKGSALLASEGVLRAYVDDMLIVSLDGAVHVTRTSRGVTIAALTAPAVIADRDQRMVVPVGMQWEYDALKKIAPLNTPFSDWMGARTPTLLPVAFLERKLQELSRVVAPAYHLPERADFLPASVFSGQDLLLPVAKDRADVDRADRMLGVVRSAVEDSDPEHLRALLSDPDVQSVSQTDRGRQTVAVLLARLSEHQTPLRTLLLDTLSNDVSLWMTASFHPRYRDIAWVLETPDTSTETKLVSVFLFPFSLLGPDSVSDLVFSRFITAEIFLQAAAGDSATFVEHCIQAHLPLVQKLRDLGYPQRAQKLADNLRQLIAGIPQPTDSMLAAASVLAGERAIDLSPLPPITEPAIQSDSNASSVSSEATSEVALAPAAVEAKAYAMLTDAGALFTVDTTIEAFAANQARISGILFSAPHRDRQVSFVLNVVTGSVSDIDIDGNTDFPYSPKFSGFIEWVKK